MKESDIRAMSDADLMALYDSRRAIALAAREEVAKGIRKPPFISVEAQAELVALRQEVDRRSRLPSREVDFEKYITR